MLIFIIVIACLVVAAAVFYYRKASKQILADAQKAKRKADMANPRTTNITDGKIMAKPNPNYYKANGYKPRTRNKNGNMRDGK